MITYEKKCLSHLTTGQALSVRTIISLDSGHPLWRGCFLLCSYYSMRREVIQNFAK